MLNIQYSKRAYIGVLLIICFNMFLSLFLTCEFQIKSLAWISILQLVFNILIIAIYCRNKIFIILFVSFSWLFHCGQIVKYAFNIVGDVPLAFWAYGTEQEIFLAFKFYYMAQIFLTVGCLIGNVQGKKMSILPSKIAVNYSQLAMLLIVIGIIPRLYIDISRILASRREGYYGVYSLRFTTITNTIAFFCDAGCIMKLSVDKEKKSNWLLFFAVTLYKILVMTSGARQQAFCFLIVWIVFYCWNIKNIKAFQKIIFAIIAYFLVVFVDYIGSVRSEVVSFSKFFESVSFSNNSLIGDILGEFGSGFCSLVVAIHGFPNLHSYGYGKSYIAAVMSAVPKLVGVFPSLYESVTYTTLFSNTTYFGGSYLGELYYNFSWLGILGPVIIGYVVGKSQKNITQSRDPLSLAWSAVLLIQFTLFIRGYITDMAQSCIWLWLFIKIYINVKYMKIDNRQRLLRRGKEND